MRDDVATEYEPDPAERGTWISALVALAGVWLIVDPFLFEVLAGNSWNDDVVGALVLIPGAYSVDEVRDVDRSAATGQ